MIQEIDDPHWLDRPSLDAAFDALLAHDLTFDALVKPVHLEMLARRLQRHPALRAVLDHAGKPDIAGGSLERWSRQIEQLARATSVCCKLSGLLTQAATGSGAAALDVALAATPITVEPANDLGDIALGALVDVGPTDYGVMPSRGALLKCDRYEIVIRRSHERTGEVQVHFPRQGFGVTKVEG